MSLHLLSTVPKEFEARQTYSPSSSGKTSAMFNVARPLRYFKSTTSDDLKVCKKYFSLVIITYITNTSSQYINPNNKTYKCGNHS